MKSLQELAREAILIQDACNLSGLVHDFPDVLNTLREIYPTSQSIAYHPIVKLWVSKIHDLAGMGLSDQDRYSDAYKACREMAKLQEHEMRS
jgi:hypothetical protein